MMLFDNGLKEGSCANRHGEISSLSAYIPATKDLVMPVGKSHCNCVGVSPKDLGNKRVGRCLFNVGYQKGSSRLCRSAIDLRVGGPLQGGLGSIS